MPIQSYNPSVFIERVETTGANANKEIFVNDVTPLKVADSVNILGNDYLIENIDTATKKVTLDKERDANINLQQTSTIEVKQKVPDPNIAIPPVVPVSEVERKEKIVVLAKDLYQRKLNKSQEILGTAFYGMKEALESETRAFLGTFNEANSPLLKLLAAADGVNTKEKALFFKEKIVETNQAFALLESTFLNLSLKCVEAQSKSELDSISFS